MGIPYASFCGFVRTNRGNYPYTRRDASEPSPCPLWIQAKSSIRLPLILLSTSSRVARKKTSPCLMYTFYSSPLHSAMTRFFGSASISAFWTSATWIYGKRHPKCDTFVLYTSRIVSIVEIGHERRRKPLYLRFGIPELFFFGGLIVKDHRTVSPFSISPSHIDSQYLWGIAFGRANQ